MTLLSSLSIAALLASPISESSFLNDQPRIIYQRDNNVPEPPTRTINAAVLDKRSPTSTAIPTQYSKTASISPALSSIMAHPLTNLTQQHCFNKDEEPFSLTRTRCLNLIVALSSHTFDNVSAPRVWPDTRYWNWHDGMSTTDRPNEGPSSIDPDSNPTFTGMECIVGVLLDRDDSSDPVPGNSTFPPADVVQAAVVLLDGCASYGGRVVFGTHPRWSVVLATVL